MKRIVIKTLPNSGVTQGGILGWIRDIIVPVTREIRAVVNARFGEVTTITSTPYQATVRDEVILSNTTGATTVYLPSVIDCTKTIIVKNLVAFNLAVYPHPDDTISGVTIDGAAFVGINTQYYAKQFLSDGYNWHLVGMYQ